MIWGLAARRRCTGRKRAFLILLVGFRQRNRTRAELGTRPEPGGTAREIAGFYFRRPGRPFEQTSNESPDKPRGEQCKREFEDGAADGNTPNRRAQYTSDGDGFGACS